MTATESHNAVDAVTFAEASFPHDGAAAAAQASDTTVGGVPRVHSTPTASPTRKCLKPVPRTTQMVVKVRDCPSSQTPIELCYQCFGDPADGLPPVLLICGLNMQLYAWDENFCESLARAGFYVIRFDNRDMGHSTKVEHRGRVKGPLLLLSGGAASFFGEKLPYGIEDMAADAWALLDALHIPCAHLFGISMGGMIAQTAALQAPERTISLTSIMSSTNAPDLPQPALWVKLWMLRRPPRNCTVEELLEFRVNSLRRLLRSALPPDGEFLKKRYLLSLRRSSYTGGLLRQAAAIRRAPGRDARLQHLLVPALVVHGAQDVVVPPMNGYRTATMLPFARMLVLKSMGHYFHPAFYSTIIAAFADMAASTDTAQRRLGSKLPSANFLQLVDAKTSPNPEATAAATAAWRRGGGTISSRNGSFQNSQRTSGVYEEEEKGEERPQAWQQHQHAHSTDDLPYPPPHNKKEGSAGTEAAFTNEAEVETLEEGAVDPRTAMMASMGDFIRPVVADAASLVGQAVCKSVMVAVPGGNSNPAVPEAVIVENLFLRNPHAIASVPVTAIVKKPIALQPLRPATFTPAPPSSHADVSRSSPSTSGASATAGVTEGQRSPSVSLVDGAATAAAATTSMSSLNINDAKPGFNPIQQPPASLSSASPARTAADSSAKDAMASLPSLPSLPAPSPTPMTGALPYVPCSPSCWYAAPPFPQRSAAATNGHSKGTFFGFSTAKTDTGGAAEGGASRVAAEKSKPSYPRFHPVVVGVPLADFLGTHPMEREASGFAVVKAAAAEEASTETSVRTPHEALAAAATHNAHVSKGAAEREPVGPVMAAADDHASAPSPPTQSLSLKDLMERGREGEGSKAMRRCNESQNSITSSQEQRDNEAFLQSRAAEQVVEATALPSLPV